MKADVTTAENSKQDDRAIPNRTFLERASAHFFENLTKSNFALVNDSLDLTREAIEFSKIQLQVNLDAWTAISKCKNLKDLSECHVELAKKATSQYTEAMSAMLSRCATLVSKISVPGQEQSQRL